MASLPRVYLILIPIFVGTDFLSGREVRVWRAHVRSWLTGGQAPYAPRLRLYGFLRRMY